MSTSILHLLTDTNKSIYLKDPIEPEKGSMRAVLNTGHLFDAEIFSYLHGGKNYKLSFDIDDIATILDYHKNNNQFEKIIDSLVGYLVNNEIDNKVVKATSVKILELTKNVELKEYFEHMYDMKYLEYRAFKYLTFYALIRIGGKVGILDKSSKVLEVISKADAKTLFDNKLIKALFSKKSIIQLTSLLAQKTEKSIVK